jgi:hypothetical protein
MLDTVVKGADLTDVGLLANMKINVCVWRPADWPQIVEALT